MQQASISDHDVLRRDRGCQACCLEAGRDPEEHLGFRDTGRGRRRVAGAVEVEGEKDLSETLLPSEQDLEF